MTHFDGNEAAGTLSEIFAFELTAAMATCDGCGATGAVGSVLVYEARMGTVLRCPECDAVLMRVVEAGDALCMEMRGVRVLRWNA